VVGDATMRDIRGVRLATPRWAALVACGSAVGIGCGGPALELRSSSEVRVAADDTVVLDCLGYPQVAPVELALDCGHRGPYAVSLKWQRWGQSTTSARGSIRVRGWGEAPVRVRLSRLTLRRDATVTYRQAIITSPRVVPAWRARTARYALQEGSLRRLVP